MSGDIRTLVCWNRTEDAAALFWHETARQARTVMVDELGGCCRIALRSPACVRMASLPPPELSFLEHGGEPTVLAAALHRLLDGARSLRVLAAGAVRSTALFEAAISACRPDVVAAPPGCLAQPLLRWPALGCELACADALASTAQAWLCRFDELATRRCGGVQRYRVDELVTTGLPPPDPGAPLPLARIAAGQRAALLLPGCGGGKARLVLRLLDGGQPWDDASCLLIDGREVSARRLGDRVEVCGLDLPPLPCHVLEVCRERPPDLVLVAIEFGPAGWERAA